MQNSTNDNQNVAIGPLGERLTREDLPSGSNLRWVARRKAQVVAAIDGGLLSVPEACARYNLSLEELGMWQRIYGEEGMLGLRQREVASHRVDRSDRKRKSH